MRARDRPPKRAKPCLEVPIRLLLSAKPLGQREMRFGKIQADYAKAAKVPPKSEALWPAPNRAAHLARRIRQRPNALDFRRARFAAGEKPSPSGRRLKPPGLSRAPAGRLRRSPRLPWRPRGRPREPPGTPARPSGRWFGSTGTSHRPVGRKPEPRGIKRRPDGRPNGPRGRCQRQFGEALLPPSRHFESYGFAPRPDPPF